MTKRKTYDRSAKAFYDMPSSSQSNDDEDELHDELGVDSAAVRDDDTESRKRQPAGSSVISSHVSDVFVLTKRHTIPTSQDIRVLIATISLNANLTYTAVPKRSTKVYVQAGVLNDSPFTLLAGSSLVFVDGSFVGSCSVPLTPTGGHAFLDAGIDTALSALKRVVSSEYKSSGGIVFSRTRMKDVQYELTLTNKRSFGVLIAIKDQVPLPQSEDLSVEVHEPKLGLVKADHADMNIDSNITLSSGGEIMWRRYVRPDDVVKVKLHFSVVVDAERQVSNFDL
eukprot:TRINITY_DN41742_c0_g1_i1.p1 TRINITY_DN41742_c0_g1~~TRINITY_DN41742_c0_g1_i1.p1  ORF type:complete len:282 (-),score=26.06 TRINITY_DN41742_c0_g1_i1:189-1034(-)